MYFCQKCNKLSEPNVSSNKLTVKTRPKQYFRNDLKTGMPKLIGTGYEIVKEINVCKECLQEATG